MTRVRDDRARLRAWWFQRQGLTPRNSPKTAVDCLRRTGWLPTAGSTGVYLSIRARMPGISRDAIDRAAIDGVDIIEVPGAHGTPPVLVPRDEMALALRLHWASYAKHAEPLFARGRYSKRALQDIARQACSALDEGPRSTAQLRASVAHPDADELLTGALVDLAVRGVIRRYPADGRLDSSKYLYELRHPDDQPNLDAEGDEETVACKATRVFLRRHGPATVGEIAEWAALTKGSVRKALTALQAQPIEFDALDDAWLLADDLRAWNAFGEDDDRVVLIPYRDPYVSVRRPPKILSARGTVPVLDANMRQVALQNVRGVNHHAIVAGGEMVGVWEYDRDTERVVTRVWDKDKTLRARVISAAVETEHFIGQQLGDAKLSAVDPPARRARRVAFCRK